MWSIGKLLAGLDIRNILKFFTKQFPNTLVNLQSSTTQSWRKLSETNLLKPRVTQLPTILLKKKEPLHFKFHSIVFRKLSIKTKMTLGPPILAKFPPLRRHLGAFTPTEKQTYHEWWQFTTKYCGGEKGPYIKTWSLLTKNMDLCWQPSFLSHD